MKEIINCFKEVLQKSEFKSGWFEKTTFAIPNKKGNLDKAKKTLDSKVYAQPPEFHYVDIEASIIYKLMKIDRHPSCRLDLFLDLFVGLFSLPDLGLIGLQHPPCRRYL